MAAKCEESESKIRREVISANLHTLKRRHYSVTEFMAVCGISHPTMRKKLTNPELFTIGEINRIAELTDTSAADLLTRLIDG